VGGKRLSRGIRSQGSRKKKKEKGFSQGGRKKRFSVLDEKGGLWQKAAKDPGKEGIARTRKGEKQIAHNLRKGRLRGESPRQPIHWRGFYQSRKRGKKKKAAAQKKKGQSTSRKRERAILNSNKKKKKGDEALQRSGVHA